MISKRRHGLEGCARLSGGGISHHKHKTAASQPAPQFVIDITWNICWNSFAYRFPRRRRETDKARRWVDTKWDRIVHLPNLWQSATRKDQAVPLQATRQVMATIHFFP